MHLRTVLQTFDSARYHKDRPFDRHLDIAHARSEVLIALLFGFDIVATANDVVDSPAFRAIFTEIVEGAAGELRKLRASLDHPFQVFHVGLEQRHQGGLGGYSAFAKAYVSTAEQDEAEGRRLQELIAIGEGARDIDWPQLNLIKAAADTYFNRSTSFSRGLKRLRPEDHRFYKLVRQEYHSASNPQASFIYTANVLTRDNSDIFKLFFEKTIARARRRTEDDDEGAAELDRVDIALSGILASSARIGRRGDWKAISADLDPKTWPVIRDWLDIALYKIIFAGFDATFPSFFTQELETGKQAKLVIQGAVTEYAYERYGRRGDAADGLLPGLDSVPWSVVLELIATKEFQRAKRDLHIALRRALETEGLEARDRAGQIEAAYDAHIAFLTEEDRRFAIVRHGRNLFRTERGHVHFEQDRQLQERWESIFQVGMKGIAGVVAGRVGVEIGDVNGVLTGLTGGLADMLNAPGRAIGSAVAGFYRPSEEAFIEGAGFLDAAKSRRNLYIG